MSDQTFSDFPPCPAGTEAADILAEKSRRGEAECRDRLLDEHLDYLEEVLSGRPEPANTPKAKEALRSIARIVESGVVDPVPGAYRRVLDRLVRVYANGLSQGGKEIFPLSAEDYAAVIHAVGNAYPGYDYRDAIGQLLFYMTRLFEKREGGWIMIYQHVRSLPESSSLPPLSSSTYYLEIGRWVEEGIENLFAIQKDLFQRVRRMEAETKEVDEAVGQEAELLSYELRRSANWDRRKVTSLNERRIRSRLQTLQEKKATLNLRRQWTEQTIGLLESDMLEVSAKLAELSREYSLRLVDVASSAQ